MAKLKIGEGIQLEAQLPEVKEKPEESRLDKVSDRVYKNNENALDAIKRTQALNEKLKEMGISLSIVEEKVDSNSEDMIQLMDTINRIDMKEPTREIVNPEIKSVTIHRDHTKEFEDVYQKMFLDKAELKAVVKKNNQDLDLLKKQNKKQRRVNLLLCISGICSLILHLF